MRAWSWAWASVEWTCGYPPPPPFLLQNLRLFVGRLTGRLLLNSRNKHVSPAPDDHLPVNFGKLARSVFPHSGGVAMSQRAGDATRAPPCPH